jgi:hypothetical protein
MVREYIDGTSGSASAAIKKIPAFTSLQNRLQKSISELYSIKTNLHDIDYRLLGNGQGGEKSSSDEKLKDCSVHAQFLEGIETLETLVCDVGSIVNRISADIP